jgi:translation initiation factor IF-1
VGHDTVVIRSDGKEQSFVIRSQARSKVAAIPIGAPALFLIDETNQVADASFTNVQAVKEAHRQPVSKAPIKGAHRQVDGTVTKPLEGNRIAVRTANGSEAPYEVRDTVQSKLAGLHKGDAIILLVDTENKVIDVAIPPPTR